MGIVTYNYKELMRFMSGLTNIYDLVRLVDPGECREINIDEDGKISVGRRCYAVWENDARCSNCGSYKACVTGRKVDKTEHFKDKVYQVLMIPVRFIVPDGTHIITALECIMYKENGDPFQKESTVKKTETGLFDQLTRMYNWDGFYQEVRKNIDEEMDDDYSVAVFSIYNYRMLKDVFGAEKREEIIAAVAAQLNKVFEADDNRFIVGRIKRDEMAVFINRTKVEQIIIERKILEAIDSMNDAATRAVGSRIDIKLKCGVRNISNLNLPVALMCNRAVMASDSIKDTNKKYTYFNDILMKRLIHEQKIVDDFDEALKDGQFKMFLQPQVAEDGQIYGAEALVRWVLPDGTIVPPGDFIDILEKSELITKLDQFMWTEAAKKLKEWRNTDKDKLYISINISPKDFFHIDVYDFINHLINDFHIDKDKLRLEITESFMMEDQVRQLDLVNRLHEEGFDIEIDDFGKGYSSLGLLKDLNADTIKIDKEFLKESDDKKKSEDILGSIIDMTNRLNMSVITEGVETKEQLEKLIRLGCKMFQGFYFDKPMCVEDFEERYKTVMKKASEG